MMKTLLPFILMSVVILGVGPWFVIPALTGQPLGRVSTVVLEWCQLFFFTPLCLVLACTGLEKGKMK